MIGHYGFHFGAEPDVFEAVARFNAATAKAARSFSNYNAANSHSRYLTADQKQARRAKDKRARQARQKHRGGR